MTRRSKFIAAFAAVSVVGGGVAIAVWSAGGSGSGQSRALTAQTITVTAATATADLYPGYTQGDVSFTLTNPNPYAVTMTSMTPGAITSSAPGACPASNVSVVGATGLSLNVGGGATTGTLTIPDVVTMVIGAPDGCQGVTFSIAMTLSGSQ